MALGGPMPGTVVRDATEVHIVDQKTDRESRCHVVLMITDSKLIIYPTQSSAADFRKSVAAPCWLMLL